jgi:predicted phosphodiesterase
MHAILSDIHANLPALEAVMADARRRGCTHFLSLGDVVGYGAQPAECIELLEAEETPNILGNHDSYITLNENCPRSRVVSEIINYQRGKLTPAHIGWLRGSLDSLSEDDILFVHGGPKDPRDQYLYRIAADTVPTGVRWLFSGHTHVQTVASFGDQGYCNPGSVGQPRDGDWRAAYVTFDGKRPHVHRVAYDVNAAVLAMQEAGFDTFCYENLFRGTQIGGRIDSVEIIRSGG